MYTIVVSSAVIFKQYMQFIGFSTVATGVEIFYPHLIIDGLFHTFSVLIYGVKKLELSLSPLLKCRTQMNYEMVHWEK